MEYFKNIEIARLYKVSKATVGNWIESGMQKKNNLQLNEIGGKYYISKTSHNKAILKELSESGQKFKKRSIFKILRPSSEFYNVFNESQIVDIISSLETYKEIPHKYTYFNGGAEYWDNYVKRTLKESIENTVTNTHELLTLNRDYIFKLISGKKVNLVDIGVGNAYPVKDLLLSLTKTEALQKYIALDMSPSMLEIVERNVQEWFGDRVNFEGHNIDISSQLIRDILFENSQYFEKENVVNLVCFLGSSIENMESNDHSLENIRRSLSHQDIFILGRTLDTESATTYFDFSETNPGEDPDYKWRWLFDALSLKEDLYSYEMLYDERTKSRIGRMCLDVDIEMIFETERFRKSLIFKKGEEIITWRHRHHSYKEIVDDMLNNGFQLLQSSTSTDRSHLMLITQIKPLF